MFIVRRIFRSDHSQEENLDWGNHSIHANGPQNGILSLVLCNCSYYPDQKVGGFYSEGDTNAISRNVSSFCKPEKVYAIVNDLNAIRGAFAKKLNEIFTSSGCWNDDNLSGLEA